MPIEDLTTDEGLRAACEAVQRPDTWNERRRAWIPRLAEALTLVQDANAEDRTLLEFQRTLWEQDAVAAVGQGNICVDPALEDDDFRTWFARRSLEPLPVSREERIAALNDFYEELSKRIEPYCRRTPHLKIFRVLAALYPGALTSIADRKALKRLYKAMGGPRGGSAVERHVWVLERLESLLGPPEPNPTALALRMALPWFLYARYAQSSEEEPTEEATGTSGESRLLPLPAVRRRRGLTQVSGGFPAVLSALEFCREGVTRQELLDHLRTEHPTYKENSLGTVINVLKSEFSALRYVGDRYLLTDRGEAVLESGDPSYLSDWLLTHILGVDNALVILRDREIVSRQELLHEVKAVNPGWTTTYAPSSLLWWLAGLGVIKIDAEGVAKLTDSGREWAERIHWQPQSLPREEDEVGVDKVQAEDDDDRRQVQVRRPSFRTIYAKVQENGQFEESLVASLHAGIWAHPRRHFAVLTGLSGSGKTLLAREYGKSLVTTGGSASRRLCTIAVQPGWYDPAALLGYVNPLRGDAYVRTTFLEFLLAAADDLENPYVAILDEMNLSHPEQYMAPLLSAMETGARIHFHSEGDLFDGVPSSVTYPANLVVIGTANMDETTHGLSDKVLDRAFTLEFWDIDLDAYPRWGQRTISTEHEQRASAVLRDLMVALAPARLHFGWRVVDDILDFLALAESSDAPLPIRDALDAVVYAKVVPKLRGEDSPRFREALTACTAALRQHGLERSRLKVEELASDLEATGSARFWR